MKTSQIRRDLFGSHKIVSVVFVFTFLALFGKPSLETSQTKETSFDSSRDSKVLLSSFRTFLSEKENFESGSWGITSILGGIGKFFALIGTSFASGITSTVLFLGQIIPYPVTATISLFSPRKADQTTDTGESGTKSRSEE